MAEERIDLNEASAEALDRLPGIGPVLAQRIVDHREKVGPYEKAEDLTSVAGIGVNSVRRLADHLVVSASAEPSAVGEVGTPEPAASAIGPDTEPETDPSASAPDLQDDERLAQDEEPHEVKAVPPGESLSKGGFELSVEEGAEDVEERESEEGADPVPEDQEDRGVPMGTAFSEGGLPEEKAGGEGGPRAAPEVERWVEPEGPEREEEQEQGDLPTPTMGSPAEMKPAPPWWRQISWVWTALLGGLLGMAFALIVFAGVNGSLDVGHSRAVLEIESDVRGLTRELQTVQSDVDSLGARLDALEGLTERMNNVESVVDDLTEQTKGLADRADAVEEDVDGLSEQLRTVSEDVAELQDEAEQSRSFFTGLQTLLQDVFGQVEGAPGAAPTPTPEGK